MMKGKDEILNILVCSKNYRGIMALLHSAYGIRFLHTFRTVVQDDGEESRRTNGLSFGCRRDEKNGFPLPQE